MNERALMGTMFAAGVLTAVVAGVAAWQLGRARTAAPADTASIMVPPNIQAPTLVRPAPPAADGQLAAPATPQRPANQPPPGLLPMNPPGETVSAVLAEAAARSAPPMIVHPAAPPPAATATMAPDLPSGVRSAQAPERPAAVAALRSLEVAPAAPIAIARASRPALVATPPAVMLRDPGPTAGGALSPRPEEPPATVPLAVPWAIDPDRAASRLAASVAAPLRRSEPATAAVPAPAPALQAPAAAPFVASITLAGPVDTPAEPATTATVPAVVAPIPAPDIGSRPRSRRPAVEKRRRLAVMTGRDPDARATGGAHRASRPARRFARHRLMLDGRAGPRSPVTVVDGSAPPPEYGPVLIRIHRGHGGRARISRIPLD